MDKFFEVAELTKSFPGVLANDSVSFSIGTGEIHALLGENGSGKSTLVKMIYGILHPDSGRMKLMGQSYAPASPSAARAMGIAMVFQHFSLFDALTVAENIALGMNTGERPVRLAGRIRSIASEYGLPLHPEARVGDLSAGERQRVEIVRCLLQDPKLLIMDEPTSVLTPQEAEALFCTLRQIVGRGTSVLYISHRLAEIGSLCDLATVLRAGKVVATCSPREKSARELAEMMVGSSFCAPERTEITLGKPLLEARRLSLRPISKFGKPLEDVSFAARRGEILGIGGIAGNGQEELVSALSGEAAIDSGDILLAGKSVRHSSTSERRSLGLLVAPEERIGHAAVADMNLIENAFLTGSDRMRLARLGMVNWKLARLFAEDIIAGFDVNAAGASSLASSLSGGNLQKFVIGREVLQSPAVLVVNQPTWGVDAASAASIRQALLDLAAAGSAVVAVSQDLDELFEISTSLAVLNGGHLSQARTAADCSREELGMLMGGLRGSGPERRDTHAAA